MLNVEYNRPREYLKPKKYRSLPELKELNHGRNRVVMIFDYLEFKQASYYIESVVYAPFYYRDKYFRVTLTWL